MSHTDERTSDRVPSVEDHLDLAIEGFKLTDVKSLLARVLFAGVLSVALLALGYPGKAATAQSARPMSCCQHDGANLPQPVEKHGPLGNQGSPCCPACALAFGVAPVAGTKLIFLPGEGERISPGQEDALDRMRRPPVPPPRSAVA